MIKKDEITRQKIEKVEFDMEENPYTPPTWKRIGEGIEAVIGSKPSTKDIITIEYLGTFYRNGDWEYRVKITIEKNKSKLLVGHPISGALIADEKCGKALLKKEGGEK